MSVVPAPQARPSIAHTARIDLVICIVLALAAFALYVRTLTPGVLDGDSGEWQYMVNILGVPHSTGYPLYILVGKLASFVPVGSPAWRVNLFSAICAALTVPFVYLLANRVTGSRAAATLSASFFALMPTLWASATIAEVYALNTLLIAVTLYFAVRFFDTSGAHDLYAMALCFGLALANHRVAFFLLPALLIVVFYRRSVLDMRRIALAALALLLPISLYLYIPVRASQLFTEQSPETWELYPRAEAIVNGKVTAFYNHTPQGVFNLVTALDNRNKVGFEDAGGEEQSFARFMNAWNLLREQMDPFAIALAFLGGVVLFRRERALAIALLAGGAAVAIVSIVVRAESTRFYFSGAYLVSVLFFSAGIGWILSTLRVRALARLAKLSWALYYGVIVFFAMFPLTALYFNFARMDRSNDVKYDLYARGVLNDNLAPNAVLVAPWEIAAPIRYFQYVEGVRPDVLTIHESPVRPQFRQIFEAAQRLERPFYYAQFYPEDKNSDEPRTVQATAIPLPVKPTPQHELDVALNESVRVVGYDWLITRAAERRTARLALYYEVLKPMTVEYFVEAKVRDPGSATRGDWSRHPVSDYYPSYLWKQGGYYRDVYDVALDADAPEGDYTADVTWFEFDAQAQKRNQASAKNLYLSGLPVRD